MTTVKLNFTVPEDTAEALRAHVPKRKRSAFVAEAVRRELKELEEQQLEQALIEGYQARRVEDGKTDEEWERATLDGWK